ncbi:MAG: aminotransferase class I/II-fold pyridoxal phosphate-dependent enzyme, partial [Schleiferiaceae bacterium]|nr:aminotransferase class I/II-fold pyridoxal phosphate-dependent enzyme [Schleiferiaceae bacterium]
MAIIDLRSDTVTKPSPEMWEQMSRADVGDDVLGDDPTVKELEATAAAFFGKTHGLFCPSGTMTNQIAIKLHTQPGDEVICHHYAHIYNYEGGGMGFNSGVQARLIGTPDGRMTAEDVRKAIAPDDVHAAATTLLALENTSNKGGGTTLSIALLEELTAVARAHHIPTHLDGARIWNALVRNNEDPTQYGSLFDTISICLSKGLGCPVGSLLLYDAPHDKQARRIRKKLGGGMRQVGYLAAAGLYALENHIAPLAEDHQKAAQLGQVLEQLPWVSHV